RDHVAAAFFRSLQVEKVTPEANSPQPSSAFDSGAPPALVSPVATPAIASPAPVEWEDVAPLPPAGAAVASASRWSGNAYLLVRDGGGTALAAGGQLGGGQVGARIAWRINRDGPTRTALAARIYAPLKDGDAAEAAAGVDFHPLPGRPLRLSVERRFD